MAGFLSGSRLDPVLPDATSPDLYLTHPTDEETLLIWQACSDEWKGALTVPQFFGECAYLMSVPLARDKGMTSWILVDKNLPPNQRTILASCETIRKRSLISDENGNCSDVVTHGVAGVYTERQYRKRGYASRMLRELSKILPKWQIDDGTKCVASVLYSDIGSKFYQNVGWNQFPSYHVEFDSGVVQSIASPLHAEDLASLCQLDEKMRRQEMASPSSSGKARYMILPDHDHIQWQHGKEEYGGQVLFGKKPHVKGAIAGSPGNRIWAIWTHRFYDDVDKIPSGNTLFILRLGVENQLGAKVEDLKAVLQAAQAAAVEWKLHTVKLWSPSESLEQMIKDSGIPYRRKERTKDYLSCLQWFGEGGNEPSSVEWLVNERYAWC